MPAVTLYSVSTSSRTDLQQAHRCDPAGSGLFVISTEQLQVSSWAALCGLQRKEVPGESTQVHDPETFFFFLKISKQVTAPWRRSCSLKVLRAVFWQPGLCRHHCHWSWQRTADASVPAGVNKWRIGLYIFTKICIQMFAARVISYWLSLVVVIANTGGGAILGMLLLLPSKM